MDVSKLFKHLPSLSRTRRPAVISNLETNTNAGSSSRITIKKTTEVSFLPQHARARGMCSFRSVVSEPDRLRRN